MGGPISFVSGSNSHQTMEEAPNSSIFFLRYLLVAAPHHHEHNGWRRRELGVGVSIPSRTSQAYSQGPSSRLGSPFMTVDDYLILAAYISIGALTIFVLWVAVRVFRRGG